jgi:hypothetical protein
VPETTPTKQGLLPADDIETVKLWLAKLAGDPTVRAAEAALQLRSGAITTVSAI